MSVTGYLVEASKVSDKQPALRKCALFGEMDRVFLKQIVLS